MKIRAIVPRDHRIEIALPADVPEGPVDLEITVSQPNGDAVELAADKMQGVLADLRSFRKQFDGERIRLSEAVLEIRREEG